MIRPLLASLALLCAAAPAQRQGKLTLDLMLDWESVSSPRLSPDGEQIVFTRGWIDKVEDRPRSDLWIMSVDGSRPRFLVKGSDARWSPDGTRIAYVAAGEPRGAQIWVMWVATREATQITRLDEAPSGIRWSPDGQRLAFTMVVPEKPEFAIQLPKRPKGAKWAEDPKVVTRLQYRRDRRGYRPRGWSHLFVVDADGGTPRQVTRGDFDHRGAEWMPDGKGLVFSGKLFPDADWLVRESEIYRADVATGAITRLTDRQGPDGDPVVSPDGQWIAYVASDFNRDTYNVGKLHVMKADGSEPRALAPELDRQVSGLIWTVDSRHLLCTVTTEGTRQLYRVEVASGRGRAVTHGTQQFRAADVSPAGLVIGTHTDPRQPVDIAAVRLDGDGAGAVRRLTDVNGDLLAGVELGAVEEIRYTSPADELPVQGWLVKPPDFDAKKKYPLILQIHGGPHGMYGVDFSFERQNHAANGYLVLYTNPRGSSGYGKAFGNAIQNAYPGKDHDDLMAGVDAVIARGHVDDQRLYVYGGSGGGVLTAWIVGHTKRFAAAVSMYPVIDWISFVGTTDGPSWYYNFAKLPWEDITEHWNRSPLKYVGNVTTPTMLITGELDLRTPMSQTEEFYQALRLRKVDAAMVRVPDEYHGAAGRRPSNGLRRILYVRGWFERHAPKAPAAASEASSDKK